MPQDILETLARCSSAGKKISPLSDPDQNLDPFLPPESITIPFSSAHDLPSALSYDRDDSAKESTNPKSHHPNNNNNNHNHGNNPNPSPNLFRSASQRYAKTSGPILGLPNRIKNVTCSSRNFRSSTTTTHSRIFPRKKKPGSVPIGPPSSPKVSCFGKVLSDRERNGNRSKSPRKIGWFVSLFGCGGLKEKKRYRENDEGDDVARGNVPERNIPAAAAPPQGLGGMTRFASGRRSASWGSDVEAGHVAVDLRRRSVDGCGAL